MTNGQSKIAACYVRVSTPGQEQEQTIESQLDEIRRRAAEDGYELDEELIFADDGWTSEMLRRPALDRLRDAAHDGRFHVLYVYDLGRISRVFAYQEVILEELRDLGVECISLHDINDPSDEGQVLRAMQGVFHQYERVKITERMRRGKMFRAREGKLINGFLPYGYIRIPRSEGDAAYAKVNEQQAEHIRMIRQWFGQDERSYGWIIHKLHEMGVPSPSGQEYWKDSTLRGLLKYDSYHTGLVYYNKTESVVAKKPRQNAVYRRVKKTSAKYRPRDHWIPIEVPKIVPDNGLYEKIVARLAENKKNAQRNRRYPYLLSGKVMCGCGSHRVGIPNGGGHYYYCAKRISKHPLTECRIPGIRADILDETVWNELARLIDNPDLIGKNTNAWIEENRKSAKDRSQAQSTLEERINRIQEEELRYAKAYGAGDLEQPQFRGLIQEAKGRRGALQKELDDLTRRADSEQHQAVLEELPKEVEQLIRSLEHEGRQRIVQKIVERIVVLPAYQAECHMSIPLASHTSALQTGYLDPQFAMQSLHLRLEFPLPNLRKRRWMHESLLSCSED